MIAMAAALGALASVGPRAEDLDGVRIDALAVVMEDAEGDYTVIDERMDETGTAGALFGLIGAAANSAHNNAQDASTADRWRETAAGLDIGAMVEAALLATLAGSDAVVLTDDADAASHTLFVNVQDWGLGRTSQETDDLRAFLKINVRVEDAKGRTVWKDHPVKRGRFASGDLSRFTDEIFVRELTRLAEKSGKSIAYEIIYR